MRLESKYGALRRYFDTLCQVLGFILLFVLSIYTLVMIIIWLMMGLIA